MTIKTWGLTIAVAGAVLLIACWFMGARRERFAPEEVNTLASRVMSFRANEARDDADDKDDDDGDEDHDRNVVAVKSEPVDVDGKYGPIAMGLLKNKPDAFQALLDHYGSPNAQDLNALANKLSLSMCAA